MSQSDENHASNKPPDDPFRILDPSSEEFSEAIRQSHALVRQLLALWPILRRLTTAKRRQGKGKMALMREAFLAKVINALSIPPHLVPEESEEPDPERDRLRATHQKLHSLFMFLLSGRSPKQAWNGFDLEKLKRIQYRVKEQQKLAEQLEDLARALRDDALVQSETIAEWGIRAYRVAKYLSQSNSDFEPILAPVLDEAQRMTQVARKVKAEKQAELLAAQAAKKKKPPSKDGKS